MATRVFGKKRILLELAKGSASYNGVKETATEQQIFSVAGALTGVQAEATQAIYTVTQFELRP